MIQPNAKKPLNFYNIIVVGHYDGNPTYDFKIFRNGSKHVIGMYDEINRDIYLLKGGKF